MKKLILSTQLILTTLTAIAQREKRDSSLGTSELY